MPRQPQVDDALLRAIELVETHSHAVGDRVVRDLGDCLLLHAPSETEPYVNRVGAIRWPEEPAAFDRRLTEILTLFASIDRRPHVWTPPAFRSPVDLEERLEANGFRASGNGARLMVRTAEVAERPRPIGWSLERVAADDPRAARDHWVREIATLLSRAFAIPEDLLRAIEHDVRATTALPGMSTLVVRDGGEAVAIGRAFRRDGIAYLLSIGTDPLAAGRGLGTLVTSTLADDAVRDGARLVALAVRTENDRAIAVYRRAGFEIVGGVAGELMLG